MTIIFFSEDPRMLALDEDEGVHVLQILKVRSMSSEVMSANLYAASSFSSRPGFSLDVHQLVLL